MDYYHTTVTGGVGTNTHRAEPVVEEPDDSIIATYEDVFGDRQHSFRFGKADLKIMARLVAKGMVYQELIPWMKATIRGCLQQGIGLPEISQIVDKEIERREAEKDRASAERIAEFRKRTEEKIAAEDEASARRIAELRKKTEEKIAAEDEASARRIAADRERLVGTAKKIGGGLIALAAAVGVGKTTGIGGAAAAAITCGVAAVGAVVWFFRENPHEAVEQPHVAQRNAEQPTGNLIENAEE